MAENKSGSRDELAEELWDIFQWSFTEQSDDIDRLESLQATHDNKIKSSVWPTISKIPIADAWATVEESIGPAMDYLFPPQPFIKLLTLDSMDASVLRDLEWAVYLMMAHKMRLRWACHRSVKDCFKVGVGYGIVEPITVTPPARFQIVVGNNVTTQMGEGIPVRSLRYRYLSPGKVVPYPSGVDFNGPDATPYAFLLDPYPEFQFRNLFAKGRKDGEDIVLDGTPNEMIKESRHNGFVTNTTFTDFIDKLGGRKARLSTNKPTKATIPASVPVLKCYQNGRHTWIFCGKTKRVIFDKESTTDTMRCPLIKWDAWLDADRWYPMNQAEADERTCWAKNLWFNALFDLMTWSLKRPLVFDSEKVQRVDVLLNQPIGIPGDVNRTAKFLESPGLDAGAMQVGQEIDAIHTRITGQKDLTSRNFSRGGSMAFQDLVASTTGRARIRHALLQLGGLESVARQTIVYMQSLGEEMDLRFQRPAYSEGKEYVENFSVSDDDIKHALDVQLDLDAKSRLGAMDMQNKYAAYDRKINSPYFDAYEVARDLCTDEYEAQRQVLPRDVVQRKQAEKEAAQQQATALGIAKAEQSASSVGEQAMAGAAMGGAA